MDITLISISVFILVAIVFLVIYLFKSINKKAFRAEDGTLFESQSDLDVYMNLYEKTKPFFSDNVDDTPSNTVLGFQKSFLDKLLSGGFPDLKTLVRYRAQFKALSDLINS